MPELDLDELERLAKAATPGPWEMDNNYNIRIAEGGHPLVITINDDEDWIPRPSDARYIVAACNALPALIKRVRELERQRDWLATFIDDNMECERCPYFDSHCTDCFKWVSQQAEQAAKEAE